MAQDYDKILREVLKEIFPVVAQKVPGIPAGEYQPLPVDLQYTSEREADQVWQVTPAGGESFVLHCEFQSTNDKQMLPRMLLYYGFLYYGFLYYQRKLPIRQYVIYLGKDRLQMDYRLQAENISFAYQLIDIKTFPYQTFLQASRSEEVLLAILADFSGEPEELIAERIIAIDCVTTSRKSLIDNGLQKRKSALFEQFRQMQLLNLSKVQCFQDLT